MTVTQLKERLERHEGDLEVLVRCQWEGQTPAGVVFQPRVLVQDVNDAEEEFVAIECDQADDESD
jgi:hypothetical protein